MRRRTSILRASAVLPIALAVCGDPALAQPPQLTKVEFFCVGNPLNIVMGEGSQVVTVATPAFYQDRSAHPKDCNAVAKPGRMMMLFGLDGATIPVELEPLGVPEAGSSIFIPGLSKGESNGYRITIEYPSRKEGVQFETLLHGGTPVIIDLWHGDEHSRFEARRQFVWTQVF